MKKFLILILQFGMIAILAVGFFVLGYNHGLHEPHRLPSVSDIQRRLVEAGYDIKIDGKCGSETQTAWDAEYCNQRGIEEYERTYNDN